VARRAPLPRFGFIAFALAALIICYVPADFSLLTEFRPSHSPNPLVWRVTGGWGDHEGSMLLRAFVVSILGPRAGLFGANLPARLKADVLAVQSTIGAGFLLFILITSNPFLRIPEAPFEGRDLNPVLQDPGLAIHPPLLYVGYVGLSISFSFAIAALIDGRID